MPSVFLDYATVSRGDLRQDFLVKTIPDLRFYEATPENQIVERIRDATYVLLNKTVLTRQHLTTARCLKLIALAATGTNNVDTLAARELGIAVCNIRGYCSQSVMQHVWALILSLTQHLEACRRAATNGTWAMSGQFTVLAHPIRELAELTFGVVGWGELGRAAAKGAAAFGMRVLIANRPGGGAEPGRVDLAALLSMADIVSLHCPLTDTTRGLIGERELALMKPDALLINTARGGLIDGRALGAALKAGRLAGAGIDVLPQEPPLADDPLLDPDIPNLIVTPHIAWAAREARQRCLDQIAENVVDFERGGRARRID